MGRVGSGVEVRDSCIRLKFVLDGQEYKVRWTLNGKSVPPTPANEKRAHRMADDIKRQIALGTFRWEDFFPDSKHAKAAEEKRETFGKLADLWLSSKGTLAAATKDQYGTAIRFWKGLLGEATPVKDITHKLLVAKIGGYPWPSAKTYNNYMIALRGVFALEYRGPLALSDPMNGIENMPVVKKLPDPLTTDERDKILADLKKHYDARVYAYFLWQFYTGMRPEEVIALRWSDVDWIRQTVRVQRVRTFKGSERDGSKTHSERDVDLLPQALEALQIMKAHTLLLKTEREGDEDTAADIFQNPITGRAWHDERSQRDTYWRPSLKRLGIRWRKAYNTRHTFATVALMAGVPPAYIASQLGHSVQMLLNTYARWIPGNDNGTAKAILAAAMRGAHESAETAKVG